MSAPTGTSTLALTPRYDEEDPSTHARARARSLSLSLSLTHTHTQILSVERFGMSAPGDIVFKELGMTADHLIKACKDYM